MLQAVRCNERPLRTTEVPLFGKGCSTRLSPLSRGDVPRKRDRGVFIFVLTLDKPVACLYNFIP